MQIIKYILFSAAFCCLFAGFWDRPLTAQALDLQREIAPFPVRDLQGNEYTFPFLGGFNHPRPQFVDIDGDGDQDLFVQEEVNALIFFENAGSPLQAELVYRGS